MFRLILLFLLVLTRRVAAETTPPASAMIAAADPRAVAAGLAILKAGGNAMDAAVAVQMVLGVVEPQSSGLGGGAVLLHYDAASGRVRVGTGGRPRRQQRNPTCSLAATAIRCRSVRRWPGAARSACRARRGCCRRRIGLTASCPGRI